MIDRIYKVYCFWRIHGYSALKHLLIRKITRRPAPSPIPIPQGTSTSSTTHLVQARFSGTTPLKTYYLNNPTCIRINLITDSINSGSLFGGVGTALIFSALLANKLNAQLRIITRTERAQPENVDLILSLYGIALKQEITFKFAAFYDPNYEIDYSDSDSFITTSWWTTAATLPSIPKKQITYLLQEDERMFYPFGDDRLKCESILKTNDINFLVNTKILYEYLVSDGLENIAIQGKWFEPAFPDSLFHPRNKASNAKKKFFFYARPNNPRNLFYFGIEIIQQALIENIIDLNTWDIYLVGKDIPNITFFDDYIPRKCENMNWQEYAQLAGEIDLGLSLMYTPHPSYPPLDLVASGAVVVTNQFIGKTNLGSYSNNLICSPLEKSELILALKQGVAISNDIETRGENYKNNNLQTSWENTFSEIINQFIV